MANSRQAKKRAIQARKRNAHNASRRSEMRTYIKKVLKAVEAGEKTLASEGYRKAASVVDKLASKGLIPKNTAARYKSRLNKKIKAL